MSNFTHITGTFLIEASGSFLNGAGLGIGEDRNVTVPKTLNDGGRKVPYVSAQSWKRWLRNTLIEENKDKGWEKSELKAIGLSEKGTTNKIAGELNPVDFPEDDIFGYMEAKGGQGKEAEEDENNKGKKPSKKVRALIRTSPFMASILLSLRKKGWEAKDEGYVHLKEGTPQPYSTIFYTTDLQAVFCLDYSRLGVFNNCGDRIELDDNKIEHFIKDNKIKVVDVEDDNKNWKKYELANNDEIRKERAGELLKALSMLRGGAKQAAFGTDVAPKAIILAPLCCGNPIFNNIFEEDQKLIFKTETFKEIIKDYKDRITGKVYIGIRKGYIYNEQDIHGLLEDDNLKDLIVITSPIEAIRCFNRDELKYDR